MQWHLKSLPSQLSAQPFQRSTSLAFVRRIHWWLVDSSQRASNAENVSIWCSHHVSQSASMWCFVATSQGLIGRQSWGCIAKPGVKWIWAASHHSRRWWIQILYSILCKYFNALRCYGDGALWCHQESDVLSSLRNLFNGMKYKVHRIWIVFLPIKCEN